MLALLTIGRGRGFCHILGLPRLGQVGRMGPWAEWSLHDFDASRRDMRLPRREVWTGTAFAMTATSEGPPLIASCRVYKTSPVPSIRVGFQIGQVTIISKGGNHPRDPP